MIDLYPLIRPALFRLAPEPAHDLVLRALELGIAGGALGRQDRPTPKLAQRLWGLDFANPIGLAAWFD